MKPVPLRAVFFDVGGTLLRPYPSIGAVYAKVGERHGFDAPAEKWETAFRAAWEITRNTGRPSLTTAEESWWRTLVFQVLDTLQFAADDRSREALFQALFAAFAQAGAWRLYPGVLDVLRGVRARGLHVGVISNWDSRLRPLLNTLRLDEHFDSITVSCEVKAEKPAPEIFRAALQTAHADSGEAVHLGDSYEEDVCGATAVGMRAILIDPDGKRRHDCRVVRQLTGVLDALE